MVDFDILTRDLEKYDKAEVNLPVGAEMPDTPTRQIWWPQDTTGRQDWWPQDLQG